MNNKKFDDVYNNTSIGLDAKKGILIKFARFVRAGEDLVQQAEDYIMLDIMTGSEVSSEHDELVNFTRYQLALEHEPDAKKELREAAQKMVDDYKKFTALYHNI